ncbi:MAG: hypothetical protein QOI61_2035 [Actinomycetota bacterium]|jgi:hypothetical protein
MFVHSAAAAVLIIEAALLLLALALAIGVSTWIAVRTGSSFYLAGTLSGGGPTWALQSVVDQLLILDGRTPLRRLSASGDSHSVARTAFDSTAAIEA